MKEFQTLTRRAEYVLVYQQGKTWVNRLLVMKALPNGLNLTRYGFSVNKRVGKAVQRNRLKRLLREISRSQSVKPGWDIIFIIRPEAVAANYHELKEVIVGALARAQMLEGSVETISYGSN